MPYIKKIDRKRYDGPVDDLVVRLEWEPEKKAGHCNYCIETLLIKTYNLEEPSYARINEAIGVLECSKLELYRRLSKHEDKKRKENGDIY